MSVFCIYYYIRLGKCHREYIIVYTYVYSLVQHYNIKYNNFYFQCSFIQYGVPII